MVASGGDDRDCVLCLDKVRIGSDATKCSEVCHILWPSLVVTRQHLERDQVPNRSDAYWQAGQQLHHLGFRRDLRLDS